MTAQTHQHPARPPITVRESELVTLYDLALSRLLSSPRAAGPLLDELERACVLPDEEVSSHVSGLGSMVEFAENEVISTVQLVLPSMQDDRKGRVSVLGPVGAALIGLSPGQSIVWCDRVGRSRQLRVLSVEPGTEQGPDGGAPTA